MAEHRELIARGERRPTPGAGESVAELPLREDERSFIDNRLYRFRRNILLPTSAFMSCVMTMGAALSTVDGSMRSFFYLPVFAVFGSWASLYLVVVSNRVKAGYLALSVGLLAEIIGLPFTSPDPPRVYVMYSLLTVVLFILLIILAGILGMPRLILLISAAVYFQFIVLTPVDQEEAVNYAQRLVELVRSLEFHFGDAIATVTMSIGVATYQARHRDGSDLLVEADQALDQAKSNGRDRVELTPIEQGGVSSFA